MPKSDSTRSHSSFEPCTATLVNLRAIVIAVKRPEILFNIFDPSVKLGKTWRTCNEKRKQSRQYKDDSRCIGTWCVCVCVCVCDVFINDSVACRYERKKKRKRKKSRDCFMERKTGTPRPMNTERSKAPPPPLTWPFSSSTACPVCVCVCVCGVSAFNNGRRWKIQ